jgi:hypothetical protein
MDRIGQSVRKGSVDPREELGRERSEHRLGSSSRGAAGGARTGGTDRSGREGLRVAGVEAGDGVHELRGRFRQLVIGRGRSIRDPDDLVVLVGRALESLRH